MPIEIARREIENTAELSSSSKKTIIYAGVACIGLTYIANAQLDVTFQRTSEYDMSKVYGGVGLIIGSVLACTVEKIYNSYHRVIEKPVLSV